jgi:hypothetical protein
MPDPEGVLNMRKLLAVALVGVTLWTAAPAQAEWPYGVIRWSNRNAKVVETVLIAEECDVNALPVPDSCVTTWRVQAKRRARQHDIRVICSFTAYQLPGTVGEVQTLRFDVVVHRGHSERIDWNYVYYTTDWACTGRKLPS